ncbi:unnamed protein product [Bursaphelenchus okinawaensis]|uniref:Uncharacterized protein n=1 Tax=Bursaphelenchus okinawaensis TaxID=465554 RepID=A0A811K992_9BILA|nr:unnamed protein product [Bursaphelenchus okinawaensis]CAG9094691.1 unnamed protein product [Bursaphelenchus okinawaensis]
MCCSRDRRRIKNDKIKSRVVDSQGDVDSNIVVSSPFVTKSNTSDSKSETKSIDKVTTGMEQSPTAKSSVSNASTAKGLNDNVSVLKFSKDEKEMAIQLVQKMMDISKMDNKELNLKCSTDASTITLEIRS